MYTVSYEISTITSINVTDTSPEWGQYTQTYHMCGSIHRDITCFGQYTNTSPVWVNAETYHLFGSKHKHNLYQVKIHRHIICIRSRYPDTSSVRVNTQTQYLFGSVHRLITCLGQYTDKSPVGSIHTHYLHQVKTHRHITCFRSVSRDML